MIKNSKLDEIFWVLLDVDLQWRKILQIINGFSFLAPTHLLDKFCDNAQFYAKESQNCGKNDKKIVKWQKIVTLMPQNCDSNVTKLWRYTKKVAWIFLISWLGTVFRFSIILWRFCHKIVPSNVQVPTMNLRFWLLPRDLKIVWNRLVLQLP